MVTCLNAKFTCICCCCVDDKDLEGISVRKVTVEIVRSSERKRFLGGYRNTLTDLVYHHAEVQTMTLRTPRDLSSYMSTRATQTYAERHFRQQTAETTSTQMTGVGVYVPDLTDKLLEPRPYVSSEEFMKLRASQVGTPSLWTTLAFTHIAHAEFLSEGKIVVLFILLWRQTADGVRENVVSHSKQEAQLPQRNSASAAHMEGEEGVRPSSQLPFAPSGYIYLCVWSNPKATTYVRQACRP